MDNIFISDTAKTSANNNILYSQIILANKLKGLRTRDLSLSLLGQQTSDMLKDWEKKVSEGLEFILWHLKEPIWPRTISTQTTEGRQIPVKNEQEALAWYKDCLIFLIVEIKRPLACSRSEGV